MNEGLPAANEVNDLNDVPSGNDCASPVGLKYYFPIDFDRDAPALQFQAINQCNQARIAGDGVRLAIERDLKIVGHRKAASRQRGEAAELRNPNVPQWKLTWLPYAGITRIRFMGFSREFSVPAHAPSHFELYHRRLSAVKNCTVACG